MDPIKRRAEREAELSPEYVQEILGYDPNTGEFRWKTDRAFRVRAGDIAGGVTSLGYYSIRIANRRYQAHRLAWVIIHGEWPTFDIDHIDGNKLNNRISNLRQASRSENCANRKLSIRNKSGTTGVFWNKDRNKWQVAVGGRYFGLFTELSEAQAVSRRAADELFSSFARNSP